MRKWLGQRQVEAEIPEWIKPSGLEVREMYRPDMYHYGAAALPEGDSPLKVEIAVQEHIQWCEECSRAEKLVETCYFHHMSKCLSHGWKPTVDEAAIMPLYKVDGNYESLARYHRSVDKEYEKMEVNGVFEEMNPADTAVWHPMGAEQQPKESPGIG